MMTGGAAGIRRQIAELRMLVAQVPATRTAEAIDQDANSVAWAERVSGLGDSVYHSLLHTLIVFFVFDQIDSSRADAGIALFCFLSGFFWDRTMRAFDESNAAGHLALDDDKGAKTEHGAASRRENRDDIWRRDQRSAQHREQRPANIISLMFEDTTAAVGGKTAVLSFDIAKQDLICTEQRLSDRVHDAFRVQDRWALQLRISTPICCRVNKGSR